MHCCRCCPQPQLFHYSTRIATGWVSLGQERVAPQSLFAERTVAYSLRKVVGSPFVPRHHSTGRGVPTTQHTTNTPHFWFLTRHTDSAQPMHLIIPK